ncbi:glutaredoxin family protein [Candidatus Contendibacter odensensis]|uniref:Glutaredoxin 2 (Modular protein) n=1 Tax=Candidatus Contendobacter odensis Run_B_J11 TaxID=1400861 RepID=A0A7U7G8Z6_9GAMM|nr:glutaredoxin family protein [Candidatus Contendobacter odensis]CDH43681.1 Glutaredoxin 2 (modular protein) [Candidatus Contendobacter odensis Run_B_J11]
MKEQESTPNLMLYTTLGCHLCAQAEALILAAVGATVQQVEISDDAELLECYGIRIPVLRRGDTGEELDWPFDAAALRRLLRSGKHGVDPI